MLHLKKIRPDIKVLAAMGGATDKTTFNEIVKTQEAIDKFAAATFEYVKDNGLDGIDVDWEFPSAEEKVQYIQLLKVKWIYCVYSQPTLCAFSNTL